MRHLSRSPLLIVTTLLAAACGSDGSTPTSPLPQTVVYQVVTGSSSSEATDATHTVLVLHLIVTRSNGSGVAAATVRLQASTGTLTATQVVTDGVGGADAMWTLPLPLPAAYTLSACATEPADAACTFHPVWATP